MSSQNAVELVAAFLLVAVAGTQGSLKSGHAAG